MHSFDDLNLSPAVKRAIAELGYEKPSPIQAETLPLLLGNDTDFLGLAATGTGKTAAFGVPLVEAVDPKSQRVQALVLCPTRELALQVAGQIDLFGKYKGIKSLPIYGGAGYSEQLRGLRQGVKIVVGTPGRVIDHIEKGSLRLDAVKTVVLDEADEMISMGFQEDIEKILSAIAPEKTEEAEPTETPVSAARNAMPARIWLFSATMSREVRKVADKYLRNAKRVQVNREEMLPSAVQQVYYPVHEGNKPEVLCKLIDSAENFYGLVFCQTKALVTDLAQYLIEKGYKVDSLHGDKDQASRERTMLSFREHKVNLLVCTDVASRGLDVKDITHVINYSLPRELDNYVHRIGRTARSGKTGMAMSLVTPSHRRLVFQIEKMTGTRMQEGKLPTRREIGARKVAKLFPRFQEQEFHARAVEVMDTSWKESIAGMSPEEVAGRFLSMMFSDIFVDREQPAPRTMVNRAQQSHDKSATRPPGAGHGPRPVRSQRPERPRPEHASRPERARSPGRFSLEKGSPGPQPRKNARFAKDGFGGNRPPTKKTRVHEQQNLG